VLKSVYLIIEDVPLLNGSLERRQGKMTSSNAQQQLEKIIKHERLLEAQTLYSKIVEDFNGEVNCHIYEYGSGLGYSASVILDNTNNETVMCVRDLEKWEVVKRWIGDIQGMRETFPQERLEEDQKY